MRHPAPAALVRVVLAGLVVPALLAAGCAADPAPAPPPASSSPTTTAAAPQPCSDTVGIDGFSDALDTATLPGRSGQTVGNLSGLAALPGGDVLALSDRSVLVTLDQAADRATAAADLVDPGNRPLDSEALALDIDGSLLVADETGPQILRYSASGVLIGALPIPPELAVAPFGRAQPNATIEGLAVLPDGRTLVASMEEPLAGDDPAFVRLVTWQRDNPADPFVPAAQYALPKPPELGVSELATIGDGRLLVLERGYDEAAGNTVQLVLADLRDATDVAPVTELTRAAVRRPVTTTLLADLGACPSLGATARQPQRNPLLDNIEGMTVTSPSFAGPLDLLLVSDDNDNPQQVTRTYRLTVTPP